MSVQRVVSLLAWLVLGRAVNPAWPAEWSLARSTVVQPGGPAGGYFDPAHPWGLVSLDWGVASSIWQPRNACEAVSVEGCRRLKAAGKAVRCLIYHNMELGLSWLESNRQAMYDPARRHFWLRWPNGSIYNERISWGDQYFWDYRNPEAAEYMIQAVIQAVNHSATDGTFTDDVGFGGEHQAVAQRLGLSARAVWDLGNATLRTYDRLVRALVATGKFNWQSLGAWGDFAGPGIKQNASAPDPPWSQPLGCLDFFRRYCAQPMSPMLMGVVGGTPVNHSIAAFLIVRAEIGYLGWGWEGVVNQDVRWDPMFALDVGEPNGRCTETAPGVFSREWTRGRAELDCNRWVADLQFDLLKS